MHQYSKVVVNIFCTKSILVRGVCFVFFVAGEPESKKSAPDREFVFPFYFAQPRGASS